MRKKLKYRKGVFIVTYLIEKDKIIYLLLKRKLHWKGWEFPKGGLEEKEPVLKGVKRELSEETGQKPLKIKSYPVSGKYKYNKQFADRKGFIGQTYRLFSAQIKNKKINFDRREHSDYIWADYTKAVSLISFSDKRKCLRIVNRHLEHKN